MTVHRVNRNARQPAYDAVYAYIHELCSTLPSDTTRRNAMIWRAVNAALDAQEASAEAATGRVRALLARWVKAGAPPLGVSLSRWWDKRLVELNTALDGPEDRTVTRPRCPHCQMPHDLTPGGLPVTVCQNIRARIAEAERLHAEGDHHSCCRADCDVIRQADGES
jgi:hypothetical protein